MSIKFEASKEFETKLQEIINNLENSAKTYEINIKEESYNDIYENIDIKIRRISE